MCALKLGLIRDTSNSGFCPGLDIWKLTSRFLIFIIDFWFSDFENLFHFFWFWKSISSFLILESISGFWFLKSISKFRILTIG